MKSLSDNVEVTLRQGEKATFVVKRRKFGKAVTCEQMNLWIWPRNVISK